MESVWVAVAWSLLPTVVIGGTFWYILRSILRMDRRERAIYADMEAQERARRGMPPRVDAR